MSTPSSLSPLTQEFASAWHLFAARWKTIALVGVLPVLPLVLLFPFLIGQMAQGGIGVENSGFSPLLAFFGIVGIVGYYVWTIPARGGVFFALAHRADPGVRQAFSAGWKRFWPLLWTELLVVLAIVIAFLPLVFFQAWYSVGIRPALEAALLGNIADLFALPVMLLFALLPFAVAVVFGYAPLATAVGHAPGGFLALSYSQQLVRQPRMFWAVAGRLLLWVLLFVVFCTAMDPLPYANFVVPFIMAMFGAAFLFTIYQELRGKSLGARRTPRVATATR